MSARSAKAASTTRWGSCAQQLSKTSDKGAQPREGGKKKEEERRIKEKKKEGEGGYIVLWRPPTTYLSRSRSAVDLFEFLLHPPAEKPTATEREKHTQSEKRQKREKREREVKGRETEREKREG